MRNTRSRFAGLIILSMVTSICAAADNPKTDDRLKEIVKAHTQTMGQIEDLQNYEPTPAELTGNVIRVEKHVTMSEKTGKIKMISYRTFRGDREIKEYIERDTDNDGQIDLYMEMFRADKKVCAALTRSSAKTGKEPKSSVFTPGVPNISVTFISKNADGKFDELLLMKDDGEFVERFQRDADGLLQPVSAREFLQFKKTAEAIAPFVGATLKAIEPGNEQTTTNKSVVPLPAH